MLSLGSINFGLGVDTASLGRAVRDVQNFGTQVDRVASQTGAGARQVEAALRKQEAAALRALESTRQYTQAVRRMNGPDTMIRSSAHAFDLLSQRMTSGRLSAFQYQRTMEDFNVRMGNLKRTLKDFEPTPNGAKFKVWLQDMTSSAVLAMGPLSGVGSRITALSSIIGRSSVIAAAFFTSLTAGGYAFYKLGEAAVRTSMDLDRVRSRLEGLSATPAEAYADFERLKSIAEQTGNSFTVLAEQWTNFKAAARGTSLEGEKSFQVFNDLSVAAAKFQLNSVAVEATFKALTQMMSKGTVQLEELKGQLGDQLPIAMQAAAKAMGVTTSKLIDMIRKGQVAADDFLPKFAKAVADTLGVKTTERIDTLRASLGRLDNAFTMFNDATNKSFGYSVTFKAGVEAATAAVQWMTTHLTELEMVVTLAGAALLGFASVSALTAIGRMTLAIGALISNIRTFGVVANAIPLIRLIAVIAAVTYAFTEFSDKASEAAGIAQGKFAKMVDQYIQHQNGMKTHSSSTTAQLINDVQKQLEAFDIQTRALLARQAQLREAAQWSQSATISGPGDLILRAIDQAGKSLDSAINTATGADTSKGDLTGLGLITYQLQKIDELAARDKDRLQKLLDINKLPDTGTGNPISKPEDDAGTKGTAAIDRRNKAIREATQALAEMQRVQSAMEGGPIAYAAFQKQDEINNKIQTFKDKLVDAKVPLETINDLVYKYGDALFRVAETTEGPFKAMEAMNNSLKESVTGAWTTMSAAMSEAIVTGELNAETFVTAIQSMVTRIIDSILQLSIINPILNSLMPGNNQPAFTGQSGWAGLFGGLFGGGASASPGLYARGGHIPTGQVGIVGEEGAEFVSGPANITPMKRAGGSSSAGEVHVNIVNHSSADPRVRNVSQDQDGNMNIDLMIEEKVNNAIAQGRFDKANRNRYGFGTQTTKRAG